MTAFKGLGTYGDGAGVVTPTDHKGAQAGQVVKASGNLIRPGLFWGGSATIISGKANMSYDVAAYTCVTTRGATSGAVFGGNDGVLNVPTTAAPGSNSRIDIIYHWHREFSLDGVNSTPVIDVVQGTAAAVPVAPSLAAFPGAIEIGRATVGAGITATTSATITQTAPFTAMAGGVIPFRSTTERDAGTYVESQLGWLIDSDRLQKYNGTAWTSLQSSELLVPTVNATGGTAAVGSDGVISFSGAVSDLRWNVDKTLAAQFTRLVVTLEYDASVTALHVAQLADGATILAGASTYMGNGLQQSGATTTVYNPASSTSWNDISNAQRKYHRLRYEITNLAAALETSVQVRGSVFDTGQTNMVEILGAHQGHTGTAAYDGEKYTFTYASGTMSRGRITIVGEM